MGEAMLWGLASFAASGVACLPTPLWRVHYLRWVDAEHRFLGHLRIPDYVLASTKRFEKSRAYAVCLGILTFLSFGLVVTSVALHFYFRAQIHKRSSNTPLEPTRIKRYD
jgi:hypothetical protein